MGLGGQGAERPSPQTAGGLKKAQRKADTSWGRNQGWGWPASRGQGMQATELDMESSSSTHAESRKSQWRVDGPFRGMSGRQAGRGCEQGSIESSL